MAYTTINFKTKKQLREAVKEGRAVRVYQPGPFGNQDFTNCRGVAVEGPHYPQPHRWYAQVDTDGEGLIIKVR